MGRVTVSSLLCSSTIESVMGFSTRLPDDVGEVPGESMTDSPMDFETPVARLLLVDLGHRSVIANVEERAGR
jgi:4-hydroxy-3-methylbut-2-en-1-yl diphosphate synthase IspG/GcpE